MKSKSNRIHWIKSKLKSKGYSDEWIKNEIELLQARKFGRLSADTCLIITSLEIYLAFPNLKTIVCRI